MVLQILRLTNHPTNCSVQNNKVAEHTQEEQGNRSGYGRNNPLALFSVKRDRRTHNLPDDNRCADDHREEGHLKPDTKTAKNRDNRKHRRLKTP